jgi:hypothetical protein
MLRIPTSQRRIRRRITKTTRVPPRTMKRKKFPLIYKLEQLLTKSLRGNGKKL